MHRAFFLLRAPLCLAVAAACTGCLFPPREDQSGSPSSGKGETESASRQPSSPLDIPTLPGTQEDVADPVGVIEALLPSVPGFCVQVRSVEERAEAERVAQAIHEKLAEDVVLLAKDLGERGVWWRVCVGTAATEEEARRAGERWTASTGPLAPFLVEASPGQARFLVLSREGRPRHRPTLAMAETLLRARSRSERPPVLFVVAGSLYGGVAFGNEDGTGAGVVIVDGDGAIVPFDLSAPAATCAACAEALPVPPTARQWVEVADVAAPAGDELVVIERVGEGPEVLSVYAVEEGRLRRVAWSLLSTAGAGRRVVGDAFVREADGEPGFELALRRYEQRTLGDAVCDLSLRVEVLDLRAPTPRRLDEGWAEAMAAAESSGGARATVELITTLDSLDDVEQASRICAAYLARGRDPQLASVCLQRVRALAEDGAVLEALHAAAHLSSIAPSLRAAVASSLYLLARRLGDLPGLTTTRRSCAERPLGRAGEAADPRMLHAKARDARRLHPSLEDVSPVFFTTATRDFGPSTPLGTIATAWLKSLAREAPAHYARLIMGAKDPASTEPAQASPESSLADGGRSPDVAQTSAEGVGLPLPPVDNAPVVGEKDP